MKPLFKHFGKQFRKYFLTGLVAGAVLVLSVWGIYSAQHRKYGKKQLEKQATDIYTYVQEFKRAADLVNSNFIVIVEDPTAPARYQKQPLLFFPEQKEVIVRGWNPRQEKVVEVRFIIVSKGISKDEMVFVVGGQKGVLMVIEIIKSPIDQTFYEMRVTMQGFKKYAYKILNVKSTNVIQGN